MKTPGDLYDHICNKLTTHPRYPTSVYTVFDFMALIVLTSLSIMLDVSHRHRATSHYIDVFYVYESRINRSVSLPSRTSQLSTYLLTHLAELERSGNSEAV